MDRHIPTKELFWYLHELEKFESITLEEQVIEKAKQAGFITDGDSVKNLSKIMWIEKVTKYAQDAFCLEDIAENEPLEITIDNLKVLVERRDKQVNNILELLAKHIIDAAPSYST